MKILFWVPYPKEGASNRYRVQQFLPFLRHAGIDYDLHSFWNSNAYKILYKDGFRFKKIVYFVLGTLRRIFDVLLCFKYDLVFIHRESYPIGGAFFEKLLFFLRRKIIFDFDDAIFLPSSSKINSFIEKFKNPNKITNIIKASKHVIAGNDYLADFASKFNKSVSVIPTSIDTSIFTKDVNQNKNTVVIGWIGSTTTASFLKNIENVFIRLEDGFPEVKFIFVGGEFISKDLKNLKSKAWSLEKELEDLRSFDIGIMPMPNNLWTRGKCGFKAILYMSMSIPCVCSPVGVNNELIRNGENGFLAQGEEEWFEKLSLLVKKPELRARIGSAGRKTIEGKYSIKATGPKFLKLIKSFDN